MKFTILIISLMIASWSIAQNGWEHIANNDFKQAKQEFEKTLSSDSANYEALTGMVFIAEVMQDEIAGERAFNTLIRNHYSDKIHYCLDHYSEADLTDNEERAFRFKIDEISDNAYDLKRDRKFEEYRQKYLEIYNTFKWSYIGPFQNINGYGFVKEFEIETVGYDPNEEYQNHLKQGLSWVHPKYHHPKHNINFKRHLDLGYQDAVCFANTFFTVDKDQEVYLRVGRSSPMKIWLDDQLVFAADNAINFKFDSEYVKISLKKGTHRLLVKSVIGEYYVGDRTSSGYSTSYDLMKGFKGGIDVMKSLEISDNNELTNRIRLTDEKGYPISLKSDFENREYRSAAYSTELVVDNFMDAILADIQKKPADLFNYFLLQSASLEYGNLSEMEEYFYLKLKENSNSVFYKYLAAKTFMINGKREKGYEALDGIDLDKNPIYVTLSDKLKEIDPVNNSEEFLKKLNHLLTVAPSNLDLIELKADYLKEEGKTDSLTAFIEGVMESYEEYNENYRLEKYLDEDYKPYDYDMNNSFDYSNKKQYKDAKKRISKEFYKWDYTSLIKKYKKDEKESKVLDLYDELISVEPYDPDHREDKAKYLFNLERYDEALKELEEMLTINPRDDDAYELMGDIYFDQENQEKALEYYLIADEMGKSGSGVFGFYGGNGLQKKIDKIKGKEKLKEKFEQTSFNQWLNDPAWLTKLEEEESLVLGYSTDLYYDRKGRVNMYSKLMIAILTEAGAASWVQYDFSRLGSIDVVKVIKRNGMEQIPDVSGGFVVFKALEPGDLIQIEASSDWTPKSDLGNELVYFNYASFHAPIMNYKLEAAFPQGKPINVLTHKVVDNKVKTTKDGYDYYKWEYKNLPKSTSEEAIIDNTDIHTNIQISTIDGWDEIVKWYQAKSYKKLDSKYEIREVLDTLIEEGMTDMEKTISVYNYITKEINYSYTSLLNSNYIPKNADLTCSSKIGDCKDVATVMINMLKELGIDAYYVLVKTNSYFDMEIVPSTYFNHVIAGVDIDGQMHYFDLTTDNYPYTVTNEGDSYAWALTIRDGDEKLFRLPNDYIDTQKNLMEFDIKSQLNKDYSIDLEVDVLYRGIQAGYLRESLKSLPKNEMENVILEMIGEELYSNIKLKEYSFSNIDDISEPLKGHYSLHSDKYSDHVLDIHFMNVPFLNAVWNSVAFSSDSRQNTLDLNAITDVAPTKETLTFSFPSNQKLYKLPEDVKLDNEYFTYELKFSKVGKDLKVEKTQIFKKQRVPVSEYEMFKKEYLELYELDKTKIVLITKGSSFGK